MCVPIRIIEQLHYQQSKIQMREVRHVTNMINNRPKGRLCMLDGDINKRNFI